MCLFTSARTVAMVLARSAGSEARDCAGVLTFDGGFMDSSSSRTKCITQRLSKGGGGDGSGAGGGKSNANSELLGAIDRALRHTKHTHAGLTQFAGTNGR